MHAPLHSRRILQKVHFIELGVAVESLTALGASAADMSLSDRGLDTYIKEAIPSKQHSITVIALTQSRNHPESLILVVRHFNLNASTLPWPPATVPATCSSTTMKSYRFCRPI